MTTEPGTIAVLHQGTLVAGLARWLRLHPPPAYHLVMPQGNQIARQRNLAGREDFRGDWLLFVDSDCVPPLDAVSRLLSHGVPLVGGVYHERFAPFAIAATRSLEPPRKWTVEELPRDGLLPVPALGTGCLLIRREVLEAVPTPWFRCGQMVPDLLQEDADFCFRAAEAGYPPLLDCGCRVGHTLTGIAWPGRDGRMWMEWPGPVDFRLPLEFPVTPDGDVGPAFLQLGTGRDGAVGELAETR